MNTQKNDLTIPRPDHTVTIGDWAGDGHDKTRNFTVVFWRDVSANDLRETFEKNVQDIGYDPRLICEKYEDENLPSNFYSALLDRGFNGNKAGVDYDDNEGTFRLDVSAYLHILMFFFTYGTDRTWIVSEPPPFLFGHDSDYSGGYGLFW